MNEPIWAEVLSLIKIWFNLAEVEAKKGCRWFIEGTDKTEEMVKISEINQLGPRSLSLKFHKDPSWFGRNCGISWYWGHTDRQTDRLTNTSVPWAVDLRLQLKIPFSWLLAINKSKRLLLQVFSYYIRKWGKNVTVWYILHNIELKLFGFWSSLRISQLLL